MGRIGREGGGEVYLLSVLDLRTQYPDSLASGVAAKRAWRNPVAMHVTNDVCRLQGALTLQDFS
jgi:hypothetical protein